MQNYETSQSLSKPFSVFVIHNRNTGLQYTTGQYYFSDGIVEIYYEPTVAVFRFAYKGRLYIKTISELKNNLTRRQLSLMAGKFGKKIVEDAK